MTRSEDLIKQATDTGEVACWAEAWVAIVREQPELLGGGDNALQGWMTTWFANVQDSCTHNRAAAAQALKEFMTKAPEPEDTDCG